MLRFAWSLRWWLPLAPVLVVLGFLVHGGCSLLAIVARGGQVVDVSLFNFHYWDGPVQDDWATFLAPIAVWIWVAALGGLGLARMRATRWARLVLVLVQVLPAVTVSAGLAQAEVLRPQPSFNWVVHLHPIGPFAAVLAACALFGVSAWRHFRRVWGGLSAAEFALGWCASMALPWAVAWRLTS